MNTKLLMTLSAVTMGVAGIIFSFLPQEVLNFFNSSQTTQLDPLVLQLLGALYFAFAMVNWTAKSNLIGGIYGRPIAIGNFCHFLIGGLALVKGYFASHNATVLLSALAYVAFGVWFALAFFTHPLAKKSDATV
jgi:hypothetical protein